MKSEIRTTRQSFIGNQFKFENFYASAGCLRIAGVDEAGRGPLAGPVVAAAIILPSTWYSQGLPRSLQGLNDSKQLSAKERDRFFQSITSMHEVTVTTSIVEAEEIDRINILRASLLAMNRALRQLSPAPDHVLVDGNQISSTEWRQTAIVKGDALSFSIAAASVVAKVTRDRIMFKYDACYPHYGFAQHKGYGTPQHLAELVKHGPCAIHRRSFSPIKPVNLELF